MMRRPLNLQVLPKPIHALQHWRPDVEDILILSARRAYDFHVDDIRLSLLSNRAVIQHIQDAFAFEVAAAAEPPETFGPVQDTMPPGLVFHLGLAPFPSGSATPVRYIHIEAQRIVIDISGSSDIIDSTFAMLMELIGTIETSEGDPAVGTPYGIRDYSDIRFRGAFHSGALAPPGVLEALASSMSNQRAEPSELIPSMLIRLSPPGEPYLGGGTPTFDSLRLENRAGTTPEENIYVSAAPLRTQNHLSFLERIEALFSGSLQSQASRLDR
jgi:hypothetical protein